MVVSIAWRIALGLVTLALLVSMGGAIFASPILLPLLLLGAARSGRPGRVVFSFLAGLVAIEVAWAVAYVVARETILEWLLPIIAFVVTAAVYFRLSALRPQPSPR
jgi:hypothetical protein